MKFLVTGDMGFLGKRVRDTLEAKGHTVAGFDLARKQNILDADDIAAAISARQYDTVIHLAAVADLNFFQTDVATCHKINVQGTQNVLQSCEDAGVRMIFAGTCCSYGNNGSHPSTEKSSLAPTEPYAASKVECENLIRKVGGDHCIMRLATFYGPGMRAALCPAVFIDRAHRGLPLMIHGDGQQTRTFTYVDDVVSGIETIATSAPIYDVINVTSEESISVVRIAELAREITGNYVPLVHAKDREGQIYKEHILNTRLRSMGWEPKIDISTGMILSYEDYKLQGGWVQPAGVNGKIVAKANNNLKGY
ncbi:uncharacterized UDP-glucose epimerase YtcB-like [Lineus longissimus]|uniref:uncharacterized UDP-glucose epimerase YtcB-like n=1 Tax=Lineus longissimus TaxID=88925 RepID=UPI002B4CB2BC